VTLWAAIVVAGIGCYALKLAGLSVPPRVLEHPVVARVADLIPVALLAALVAVQVVADSEQRLVVDARAAAPGRVTPRRRRSRRRRPRRAAGCRR
jgi:branched-subunit amino acid transport protein